MSTLYTDTQVQTFSTTFYFFANDCGRRGQLNKIIYHFISVQGFLSWNSYSCRSFENSHLPGFRIVRELTETILMCCCSQTFHNERYLFFTTLWFFQLYDFARRKNFRASKLAELGKEVDIWLALYFRCFSVETALPFFRSDHKFLVHNSSLKKPAFIKEFVKDMVRLFHHWGFSEKDKLPKKEMTHREAF